MSQARVYAEETDKTVDVKTFDVDDNWKEAHGDSFLKQRHNVDLCVDLWSQEYCTDVGQINKLLVFSYYYITVVTVVLNVATY